MIDPQLSSEMWYLATKYSPSSWCFPKSQMELAYKRVTQTAALMIARGINVYSPITHCHPISQTGYIDALDHDTWLSIDRWYVKNATGLYVLDNPQIYKSKGVATEVHWTLQDSKPAYMVDEIGHIKHPITSWPTPPYQFKS